MSHTNSTTNYGLPQWIGSDKPTFLGDFNSAFNTIDGQMKQNSTDAGQAISTANSANATAIDAAERSITAKSTADTAKDTADAANELATNAGNTATIAKNAADAATRTAEANNIANLAPAYDPTLTYDVGDLVTYIDENNSGKLYKCIVAWETPGKFNINYWDDVTVSEMVKNYGKTLVEVEPDGTKTFGEMVKEAITSIPDIYTNDPIMFRKLSFYAFDPRNRGKWFFDPRDLRLAGGTGKLVVFTRFSETEKPSYNCGQASYNWGTDEASYREDELDGSTSPITLTSSNRTNDVSTIGFGFLIA